MKGNGHDGNADLGRQHGVTGPLYTKSRRAVGARHDIPHFTRIIPNFLHNDFSILQKFVSSSSLIHVNAPRTRHFTSPIFQAGRPRSQATIQGARLAHTHTYSAPHEASKNATRGHKAPGIVLGTIQRNSLYPDRPIQSHAKHMRWRNSGAVKTKLYLLVFTATRAPSALAANLPSKTLPIPPSFRRGLTTLCHASTVPARPCVCTKEKLLEKHSSWIEEVVSGVRVP